MMVRTALTLVSRVEAVVACSIGTDAGVTVVYSTRMLDQAPVADLCYIRRSTVAGCICVCHQPPTSIQEVKVASIAVVCDTTGGWVVREHLALDLVTGSATQVNSF
jgi:uncharacterized protein YceK